ncbi:trimeric intracellular cation channel family protein [Parapedomonas caeni]|jgi:uncharacterized membrane protein YeiH
MLFLPPDWVAALNYAGVGVFAATGALAAARNNHDLVTFAFFAGITGVGGGTLRDLLIDAPVFWLDAPAYLSTCLGVAVAVWLLGGVFRSWRYQALLWLDAVGLGAYAVLGVNKALAFGVSAPVAAVMGVITATFGGVIRDVLAGEPSILLRREIYVTAALVAAVGYVALIAFGITAEVAAWIAAFSGFGVRAGAMLFGWNLPGYARRD